MAQNYFIAFSNFLFTLLGYRRIFHWDKRSKQLKCNWGCFAISEVRKFNNCSWKTPKDYPGCQLEVNLKFGKGREKEGRTFFLSFLFLFCFLLILLFFGSGTQGTKGPIQSRCVFKFFCGALQTLCTDTRYWDRFCQPEINSSRGEILALFCSCVCRCCKL